MSSFLADLAPLFAQVVCWQQLISRDKYATPTYGQVQIFQGRRVFKFSRVAAIERGTKGQGSENISESQIWIAASVIVGYEDLIYVQGDTIQNAQGNYIVPAVLSVQNTPDEFGPLFTKIFLGSSNG